MQIRHDADMIKVSVKDQHFLDAILSETEFLQLLHYRRNDVTHSSADDHIFVMVLQ